MNAAILIAQERMRQIRQEGHALEQDSNYDNYELLRAAITYLGAVIAVSEGYDLHTITEDARELWPWSMESFKPTWEAQPNIQRGAALAAAALDVHLGTKMPAYEGKWGGIQTLIIGSDSYATEANAGEILQGSWLNLQLLYDDAYTRAATSIEAESVEIAIQLVRTACALGVELEAPSDAFMEAINDRISVIEEAPDNSGNT